MRRIHKRYVHRTPELNFVEVIIIATAIGQALGLIFVSVQWMLQ